MRTITVALGEKTYNIEIAAGLGQRPECFLRR